MSISIMSAVWQLENLSHTEKLILLCLADNANDEGVCWPSIENIRKRCSLNKDTVCQLIEKLCDEGFLNKKRRFSKSTIYTISPSLRNGRILTEPETSIRLRRKPVSDQSVSNHQRTIIDPPLRVLEKNIGRKNIILKTNTFDEAKHILPKADIYSIENQWKELDAEFPKNPDAAFIGYCRNFAKNHPELC